MACSVEISHLLRSLSSHLVKLHEANSLVALLSSPRLSSSPLPSEYKRLALQKSSLRAEGLKEKVGELLEALGGCEAGESLFALGKRVFMTIMDSRAENDVKVLALRCVRAKVTILTGG